MAILTPPQGSISQVCHVTHDLKAAAARWARIGAGPFFLLALPEIERNYRGGTAKDTFDAAIGFSGTTCIELVRPTNDQPSIFREVLDRHGEGAVHHHYPKIRCLTAPEYDALCASYRTLGYEEALSFHLPGLRSEEHTSELQSLMRNSYAVFC